MVSTCCVPNCYTFQLKDRKLKFHRFPRSPIRKRKWIEAIFKDKNFEPLNASLVCEKHFRKFDYIKSVQGTKILAGNAVPSVFSEENNSTVQKESSEETASASHNFLDSAAVIKEIRKDNFHEICRCCVISKGEVNVFDEQFHNVSFSDLIYFCTNERVLPSDGLSILICVNCKQQIINSFTFINKVRDNQVHLRKLHQIFSSKCKNQSNEETNFTSHNINNNIAPIKIVINNSEIESSSVTQFKQKYKGLTKVYKQLCEILLKNKSLIKRRAKMNQKMRENLVEACIRGQIAQEQDIISVLPAVYDEEDLSSTEVCEVEQEEINDPHQNSDVHEKENPNEKGMEFSLVSKNECGLTESYPEVFDDNIENYNISRIPEDELKTNADKFVQSNIFESETNEDDHSEEKEEADNEEMKETSNGTQCFDCPEVFHTEAGIIRHCRLTGHNMTDRFKCKLCSSTFRLQRRYRMHLQQHKERKCICEICGASVFSNNFKRHLEVHTDMRIHVCPFCGRTYAQKGTLDYHIKYHHFGETNKSLCFICGKSFRTSSVLNKHLNDKHVDDDLANKSYQCDICEKFFVSKVSLSFHQKFSHSENPIERARYDRNGKIVSVDQKRTTSKRPPKNSQRKLKFCSICLKSMNPSTYKIHMLMHHEIKPFECKICHKHFRQRSTLKSHMMNIHLNRKPYKCKHCLKCFTQKMSLINHLRRHTGERPYRCPVCDVAFITVKAMRRHHQTHEMKHDDTQ